MFKYFVVIIVSFFLLLIWQIFIAAARLDRLNRRVDVAVASLDIALVRRAGIVRSFANGNYVGADFSPILAGAATECLGEFSPTLGLDREAVEQNLTLELSQYFLSILDSRDRDTGIFDINFDSIEWRRDLFELEHFLRKIEFAQHFYNDAAFDVRRRRKTFIVKAFRLSGSVRLPLEFTVGEDMVDSLLLVKGFL